MVYFLGIDGGGSHCRARLESADGQLLAIGEAGPANVATDSSAAYANISQAVGMALQRAGLGSQHLAETRAVFGLAGFNLPAGRQATEHWPSPYATLQVTSDMHIACLGAHAGEDGAILILGTGSSALLNLAGEQTELGGYGLALGDQASGAWLGLSSIALALQMFDAIVLPSPFLTAVVNQCDSQSAQALSAAFQCATAKEYAQLAPLVFQYAASGDPHAQCLIDQARVYIESILARLQVLGAPRMALVGGVSQAMRPYLSVTTQDRLTDPLLTPVEGALLWARRQHCGDKK